MDKETFGACYHILDMLELEAFKVLERMWNDPKADSDNMRDQTNVLMGIKSAKQQVNLLCILETGKSGKDCYKEYAA